MKANPVGLIWLILSLSWFFLFPPIAISRADQAHDVTPQEFDKLSLKDYILLVRQRNEQILSQHAQWAISKEDVEAAKSIFEPVFLNTYQHQDSNRRNTVREQVALSGLPFFFEERDSYEVAVEGLAPIGSQLRLGYSLDFFHNTLDGLYGIDREYETFFGFSMTQPLLKGRGVKATTAGIRAAEEDAEVAFQMYRGQIFRIVSEAVASYWDLYLAQEIYKIRVESTGVAEEILRDSLERLKVGKVAETEVLEARAGLAVRNSLVNEARQAIVFAKNHMLALFSSFEAQNHIILWELDQIEMEEIVPAFSESVRKAFKLQPEYLSSLRKVEREKIKLEFAKNQRWPQLDLTGSLGLNGLAESWGASWDDAWDRDFTTWAIGIELRIPLTGDKKSRSELQAAKHRKKQAILEVKAAETSIVNNLDTATAGVKSALDQARYYTKSVGIYRNLLDVEIARLAAGKSNSRLALEREEDLINAREAEIQSLVNYKKALLQFEVAEGSLLLKYGIEPKEKDF